MPKSRGWYTNCRGGYWCIALRKLSYPSALTKFTEFECEKHFMATYSIPTRTKLYSHRERERRLPMLAEDWHLQQCSRKRAHTAMSDRKSGNACKRLTSTAVLTQKGSHCNECLQEWQCFWRVLSELSDSSCESRLRNELVSVYTVS
jgi:hypothetical protein